MLIAAAILACILLAFKYVPVCSEALIEGAFQRRERNWRYSKLMNRKTAHTVFFFDYACRECFEKNINPHGLELDGHGHLPQSFGGGYTCYEEVPEKARRIGIFKPQKGDSAKITVRKNVFGEIIAYRIEQTNFADEFGEKQTQKYREEWNAHFRAWEGIQAEQRGMTIEQYRVAEREEAIQKAAKILDITPEEVIAAGWHERLFEAALEATARRLSRKLGKTVTAEEALRDYAKRIDKPTLSEDIPDPGCIDFCDNDKHRWEYVETSTLTEAWALDHLTQCKHCSTRMNKLRQAYLEPAGPECFSDEELPAVKMTGMLPKDRQVHADNCYRCRLRFNRWRDEHMASPPGPECLTREDLHEIHTSGKIPETCRAHIQNCERCRLNSTYHLQHYVDRVTPFPRLRLTSLQRAQRTA